MSVDIRVPTLGESVTEATIGQWFKKVGDAIAVDEPLVELETDKVTIEVPAPQAGVLESITAKPGDTVNVGALIGAIGDGTGATAIPKVEAKSAAAPAAAATAPAPAAAAGNGQASADAPASPSAQKLMAEAGLAAAQVEGSGRRGTILKEDVLAATAKPAAPAPAEPGAAAAPATPAAQPAPAPAL
ncbi:MAG: E3 binding domain-containing protein, partial [Devosia sp.]|nr:E3 binding domain-containing protein [Devosia sp.]